MNPNKPARFPCLFAHLNNCLPAISFLIASVTVLVVLRSDLFILFICVILFVTLTLQLGEFVILLTGLFFTVIVLFSRIFIQYPS